MPILGISYIETKSLDGETNLKRKQTHEKIIDYSEDDLINNC